MGEAYRRGQGCEIPGNSLAVRNGGTVEVSRKLWIRRCRVTTLFCVGKSLHVQTNSEVGYKHHVDQGNTTTNSGIMEITL